VGLTKPVRQRIMHNAMFVIFDDKSPSSGTLRGFKSIVSSGLEKTKTVGGLAGFVYSAIRDGILRGDIPPNTQLNQLRLAKQLGVDQRTVREGLMRLTAEGLVVHQTYKGFRVAKLDYEQIQDLFRIRQAIEPLAMEAAAKRILRDELVQMRNLLPESGNDPDVNRRFHWIAIEASRRPQLIRALEQVWDLTFVYVLRRALPQEERNAAVENDLARHADLLHALEVRDGSLAAKIAEVHVGESYRNLLARWESLKGSQMCAKALTNKS